MKHNFQEGIVVENDSLIRLSSGEDLRIKRDYALAESLPVGCRVTASWKSPEVYPRKFRGVRYLDPNAVETIGRWKRVSRYTRRFAKQSHTDPFQAEQLVIRSLRTYGIRAEAATDFEDEMLGVDVWIFLLSERWGWVWLPLDITLRKDMSPHRDESKYSKAFERGVIAVQLDYQLERHNDPTQITHNILRTINKGLEDLQQCGRSPLARKEAMRREVNDLR